MLLIFDILILHMVRASEFRTFVEFEFNLRASLAPAISSIPSSQPLILEIEIGRFDVNFTYR